MCQHLLFFHNQDTSQTICTFVCTISLPKNSEQTFLTELYCFKLCASRIIHAATVLTADLSKSFNKLSTPHFKSQ